MRFFKSDSFPDSIFALQILSFILITTLYLHLSIYLCPVSAIHDYGNFNLCRERWESFVPVLYIFLSVLSAVYFEKRKKFSLQFTKNANITIWLLTLSILGGLLMTDGWPASYGLEFKLFTYRHVILGFLLFTYVIRLPNEIVNKKLSLRGKQVRLLIALVTFFFLAYPGMATEIRDPYHSGFAVDELFSVISGKYPGFNYVSQYTSIIPYGFWALFKINHYFGLPFQSPTLLIVFIFSLQCLLFMIPIYVFWNLDESHQSLVFAPALYGATLLAGLGHILSPSSSSNISSYWQVFPIRLVFPVILLLSLYLAVKDKNNGYGKGFKYLISGSLASLCFLNNIDWGLAASVAFVATLFLTWYMWCGLWWLWSLVGLLLPFAIILLLNLKLSLPYRWDYLFQYVKSGSMGQLLSIVMSPYGFHVVLLCLISFFGSFVLIHLNPIRKKEFILRSEAFTVHIYLVLFAAGSSVYFISRSVSSNWQALMFPMVLLIISSSIVYAARTEHNSLKLQSLSQAGFFFSYLFLAIATVAVFFGPKKRFFSIMEKPFIKTISQVFLNTGGEPIRKDLATLLESQKLESQKSNRSGFVLTNANYLAAEIGFRNANLFNYPMFEAGPIFNDMFCQHLSESDFDAVFIFLPNQKNSAPSCTGYQQEAIQHPVDKAWVSLIRKIKP